MLRNNNEKYPSATLRPIPIQAIHAYRFLWWPRTKLVTPASRLLTSKPDAMFAANTRYPPLLVRTMIHTKGAITGTMRLYSAAKAGNHVLALGRVSSEDAGKLGWAATTISPNENSNEPHDACIPCDCEN
jgi:hypothetical protein